MATQPPKSPPIPPKSWQRPWLVDDDLKHDEAVAVGCPDILTGERIIINFPVGQVRAFMAGDNKWGTSGHLVVNRGLIRDLSQAYGRHGMAKGAPPDAIEHLEFPFMRFAPLVIETFRTMREDIVPGSDDVVIPAAVRVLVFLAVRKKIAIRSGSNGGGQS